MRPDAGAPPAPFFREGGSCRLGAVWNRQKLAEDRRRYEKMETTIMLTADWHLRQRIAPRESRPSLFAALPITAGRALPLERAAGGRVCRLT